MRSLGRILGGRDPGRQAPVRPRPGGPRLIAVFAVVGRRVPHRLGAVETS